MVNRIGDRSESFRILLVLVATGLRTRRQERVTASLINLWDIYTH